MPAAWVWGQLPLTTAARPAAADPGPLRRPRQACNRPLAA